MLEFTGERVVPGLVDPNLFNEHLARYRFAARFAEGRQVLDAGCGSGYGTAELANAARVVAMDISGEATAHARLTFSRSGAHFLQGACESLPFADASFDLVVAFEVIEHLERWREMLAEARRVLRPSGVLLVSTPNKAFYAESRAEAGPNPYHVREFEYADFEAALEELFPHVQLWNQNHSESISFVPAFPTRNGALDAPADTVPEEAHFFLAACSLSPIADTGAFVWLPTAGNVLRERQHHIALLESELEQKNAWLAEALDAKAKVQNEHTTVLSELQDRNAWATRLDGELDVARSAVSRLESEADERLDWIRGLDAQIARGRAEIERLDKERIEQKETIAERTQWARSLEAELQQLQVTLKVFESAVWVRLGRFLRGLLLLILAPLLLAISAAALAVTDLAWLIASALRPSRCRKPANTQPKIHTASLVIPNWNGKDLLERFLPSWLAAVAGHPGSEIIVVDNGSADGSAQWIRENYPDVRVIELPKNLGFGGGSNAGIRAANNDIVVLLNSDMRVEPDFLAPLLAGFTDDKVFAVSCQIFLGDPKKRREETGLTHGLWRDGALWVGHTEDPAVDRLFPCFYGGGGSCAFDRRKFLELGGFDPLLGPFYLEDTDLGFLAWKRGWKVLYQPASVVHHEHRGTIGKNFSGDYIQSILHKNFLLFCWKNIHGWSRLRGHFFFSFAGAVVTAFSGNSPTRTSAGGILRAFLQLPESLRSRWIARSLAIVDDTEAFRRSQPAWFHDRFAALPDKPNRPRVLLVSPYPICPPTHGGGLFMYYTLRELSRSCNVHAIVMLDYPSQRQANEELLRYCETVEFYVRTADRDPHLASITPHAVHEFQKPRIEWLIQRQTLLHRIDVIQLEYTALSQYARRFQRTVCALFEHDVYFQAISRSLPFIRSPIDRIKARFEYLRALRFELKRLPFCDHIQVCTEENKRYLESFRPALAPRIDSGMRAGIETRAYPFPGGPREPLTMLFLGSFRHAPNQVALEWFARFVLPLIVEKLPQAHLLVAGSDPPPRHALADPAGAVQLLGFVEDIQPLFSSCSVFVCPIRSGSGVRVKLLEAFAAGIPVVSTTIGAEGLARVDGGFCALADDAPGFAAKVIELLEDCHLAREMAARAREEVTRNWDMEVVTQRLVGKYRELIESKRRNNL